MAQGFRFKLMAQQYRTPSLICKAPFEIILPEGDPRLPQFRNPSFKEEPVVLPDDFGIPAPPAEPEPPPDGQNGEGEISLDKIEGIAPAIVKQLKKAGFATAQAVVAITLEDFDLTTLDGVGEATAVKIVAACQDAIDASQPPPDGQNG